MNTVAVVIARMGSSRLRGKVLMDLAGWPVLKWVVQAVSAAVGVEKTIVATSTAPADKAVEDWCKNNGIACYRGSENDVLSRVMGAAVVANADTIIRATADCPFIDPNVLGDVIRLQNVSGCHYTSNVSPRSWPDGLDVECFSIDALRAAHNEVTRPIDRECVTTWIQRNRSRFPAENVTCPLPGLRNHRWVLDTKEDYEFCQRIANKLTRRPARYLDILEILDAEPELQKINNPSGTNAAVNERFYDALAMEEIAPRSYNRCQQLLTKAESIIPLGAQTFSKSKLQFPQPAASFLSHGDGCRVWDTNGHDYIDLMSGLLPVVLGYCDPDIDRAIRRQLDSGISFSLATEIEHELASKLVELIPCAEMVRFGKTGTDATTAAVRLARAFTRRQQILKCVGGYHGWADWTVDKNLGVPNSIQTLTERVVFGETPDDYPYAAVIVEPETSPEYLKSLRSYCDKTGALLIFDEVITGFRFSLGGAQKLFGVTPDLACFGKSMANGMPISAIVGRRDIMMKMVPPDNIFYSGTFFGETLSIAAAIATIKKMERENVIWKLERIGLHLAMGVNRLLLKYGLDGHISVSGHASLKRLKFKDDRIAALFRKEMMASGTLIVASNNVMASLDANACKRVLRSYDWAFDKIKQAIEKGEFEVGEISGGVR